MYMYVYMYMGVPRNGATSKWMACNGKSFINGRFGGTPISGNLRICILLIVYDMYICLYTYIYIHIYMIINYQSINLLLYVTQIIDDDTDRQPYSMRYQCGTPDAIDQKPSASHHHMG